MENDKLQNLHKDYIGSKGRISQVSELNSFLNRVNSLLDLENPESFWSCEPVFKELLQSGFLLRLVNYELQKLVTDTSYVPVGGSSELDLTLVLTELYSMSLKLLEPNTTLSPNLYSNTEHIFMGVLPIQVNSRAIVELFHQPDPYPNDILDQTKKLTFKKKIYIQAGDLLKLRAPYDIFRITEVKEPLVLLLFTSRRFLPLRWEYNIRSHCPARAIAASSTSSRLEYTAKMLYEIGNENSIESLRPLLNHSEHFVRWAAVKSIVHINAAEGINALFDMLTDSHPHIRKAAQLSLEKLRSFTV